MAESNAEFIARIGLFGEPMADPAAVLRRGNARFTVLTDRLVRLEWAPDGRFEDRSSYAFPSRRGPVPAFTVADGSGTTVIDTGALRLRYLADGLAFHADNLAIELTALPGTRWQPGLRDRHNLGGARRTVDTCRGAATLEPGLVSRSGWALHDDGTSMLFDPDGWVRARAGGGALDWYFFGYGHDYPAAVRDYLGFGGAVPLIPRWMLGAWWSKYWPYSDRELRELAEEFRARELPLDVLVIDMDWHLPDSWTGYTWNRELFPDPHGFLSWLHQRGLHSTLNLHPALGVQPFEAAYRDFVHAMRLDPDAEESVPFHVTDPAYLRAYFELLHHPLEDQGVDFWWMDWQQGRSFGEPGIDPLPWLNHLHFTDLGRHPERRPVTFSRWGGLGSHRYPIGFSGDSFAQWSALRFQPRYTAAGANVGYGWWSHDIGGHVGPDDPELYVRWVQFGALSPILRLHSNQDPASERRPWMFGERVLSAAREAFQLRYQLVPYLYTAARLAADTGIAPVRPMAWLAPDQDSAYAARFQYQLGEAMVVAPVLHPAEPGTGLAIVDVWLPAGEWVERSTLERFTGPRWVRQLADLHRVPQFVRLGSVLPLAEVAPTTAAEPADRVILEVFPAASGTGRLYQDDGSSSDYRRGQFHWVEFATTMPDESRCEIRILPGAGTGAPDQRQYRLRLAGTVPPREVLLDGEPHLDWRQDGLLTVIELPPRPADQPVVVLVSADGPLCALGPAHDAAVRAADLRRLLGRPELTEPELAPAVLALPADHPSRPAALGRLGGPALRVDEHTAPDEAAEVLGRVIVGVGAGERVSVQCDWTLERGEQVQTFSSDPVEVGGAGLVIDAPFRWDDSLTATRWSVLVSACWDSRWGEVRLEHRHRGAVLNPSLPSWTVAVSQPGAEPAPAAWRLFQADPFDIDFAELTERYGPPLQHDPRSAPDQACTVHARTRLNLPHDREVAFAHHTSDDVAVFVDGRQLASDVTGAGPSRFYDLDPRPRRTEPVYLTAGTHDLLFRCAKAAELPWHQWCLTVSAVDPADGEVLLDIGCDAGALIGPVLVVEPD
ncbi:MAG: TIM-barrel domain-containing protein [Jatrophihabitantaceae bacterium]